ncbi:ABC transporter substrate-binding protein [Tsuneonella sp. CC-YZS046]|uniref:ABC transporter substrate-binding protein n=1 Tax=Tsuneonella sp. CC-YZS046 TaxID=3042152 RepID=UPI002D78A54D|nr:ABC transporter substrate-binding protein [Tsuneonella sp. CC-YZS046]WRO65791.1 ABC transporter substrate-binding protein [Tsuneonella sp. CC-YZS046]
MIFRLRFLVPAVLAALLLAGCGADREGVIDLAVIGDRDSLLQKGTRLSPDAQLLRSATVDGLVRLDANGDVTPALAERWIVTDDGRSYIFRLRNGTWPDGAELSSESVEDAFRRTLRSLKGTSLALDLSRISEIRAMAGRVVEIRLTSPMPNFLQLLAQPELGLFHKGAGQGLMRLEDDDELVLHPLPPQARGEAEDPSWPKRSRELRLRAVSASQAILLFDEGKVDLVLGGQIETLPLVDTGPLSRGTVRLDRVIGLFGLQVLNPKGVLAEPSMREAVAMAIDRPAVIAPFNVGGWDATTRFVSPGLDDDLGTIGERWESLPVEDRQREAARRVAAWSAANGAAPARLSVFLPEGPGSDIVLTVLRGDLAKAGFVLDRAATERQADLIWVDRVARYAAAEWFLNQFNCSLRRGACSPEADARVEEARAAPDAASAAALLAEAEAELTAANVYIPIGVPLRWSLVRSDITGFAANRWGFHPLPPLAVLPK